MLRSISFFLSLLVSFSVFAQFPALQGPVRLLERPDAKGHADIIQAVRDSKVSIDMTMFHLTDYKVMDALIDAQKRHGKVRVVLDQKSLRSKRSQKIFDQMKAAGIEARASSPMFTITHEKAMIVDGKTAFITSINLAMMANAMRDLGVVTEDPTVVAEMQKVYETDWQNAQNGTGNTPELTDPNLLWSPLNATPKLLAIIESAKKDLVITVENLSNQAILDAIAGAAKRGVSVRLIVPMCTFGDEPTFNFAAALAMKHAGVQSRLMPSPSTPEVPYMHLKMILADGQLIYIGSENFSNNSLRKARELGIIFPDAKIGARVLEIFEKDWKVSVDVPNEAPTTCPKLND